MQMANPEANQDVFVNLEIEAWQAEKTESSKKQKNGEFMGHTGEHVANETMGSRTD
jgi:hypothetical protein